MSKRNGKDDGRQATDATENEKWNDDGKDDEKENGKQKNITKRQTPPTITITPQPQRNTTKTK